MPDLTVSRITREAPIEPATQKSKVEAAAKDFEALLVVQLLRSGREGGGWLGGGEDQTASPAIEMAEEHFAKAIAAQGGIGLASLLTRTLTKDEVQPGNSNASRISAESGQFNPISAAPTPE